MCKLSEYFFHEMAVLNLEKDSVLLVFEKNKLSHQKSFTNYLEVTCANVECCER